MTNAQREEDEQYEQQWQTHLAYETKTWLTLEAQHREETGHLVFSNLTSVDQTALMARHEGERKTLLQQHRVLRIALRKTHQQ